MLSSFLLENLACPTCQAHPLKVSRDSLTCPVCSQVFPIRDSICYLLPDYSRFAHYFTEYEADKLTKDRDIITKKGSSTDESIGQGYDEKWMIPGSRREVVERVTAFEELALQPDVTCLDLGAGTLRCSLYALEKGAARVCGIDLNPGMLKAGRRKAAERGYAERVDIVVADVRFIPFRDETFDSLISLELIEHIPVGATRIFQEIFRVLKPGGKAVVNTWSVVRQFRRRRERNRGYFRGDSFYKFYFPKEFKLLFTDVAFCKKKIYGHYLRDLYGLLYRLHIPHCLEAGMITERMIRRYLPSLSILLGSFLMVYLEK